MRKSYLIVTSILFLLLSTSAFAQEYTKGTWFDVSLGTGDYMGLSQPHTMYAADVAVGYRFNPHLALGAGTGVNLGVKTDAWNIPAFVRLRYDMLDSFASPFVSVDLGYAFTNMVYFFDGQDKPVKGVVHLNKIANPAMYSELRRYMLGLYDNVTIGCSFKVEGGHRVWIGVSGSWNMTGYRKDVMGKNGTVELVEYQRDLDCFSGMLRIGYDF